MTFETPTDIEKMLDYAVLQYEISEGVGLSRPMGAAIEICPPDEKPIIFESTNLLGNPISEIDKILKGGRSLSKEFQVRTICISVVNGKRSIDTETAEFLKELTDRQVERPSIYLTYRTDNNRWQHRQIPFPL